MQTLKNTTLVSLTGVGIPQANLTSPTGMDMFVNAKPLSVEKDEEEDVEIVVIGDGFGGEARRVFDGLRSIILQRGFYSLPSTSQDFWKRDTIAKDGCSNSPRREEDSRFVDMMKQGLFRLNAGMFAVAMVQTEDRCFLHVGQFNGEVTASTTLAKFSNGFIETDSSAVVWFEGKNSVGETIVYCHDTDGFFTDNLVIAPTQTIGGVESATCEGLGS
ncbi:MAG: hypothetical protein OYG31_01685 [Candidatus Kaiserbacteria bacterium]|nr:hypothetical protein [Candidatus Kaiserbacteria bacterium]